MAHNTKFLLAVVAAVALTGGALAQTLPGTPAMRHRASPSAAAEATSAADQSRLRDSLKQCLSDWDKGTHITKKRWGEICQEKFRAAEKAARADKAKAAAELAKMKAKNSAPKAQSQ
ncbi:MAG: hypothetical protein JSS20_09760 [Proteobacteria bacterium]|nr:hypothetical protein [Pseudomonadota bacterium]